MKGANRRGFALWAVLWVTVALTTLAGGAVARARDGEGAAAEQIRFLRGRWAAEGRLAAAHARLVAEGQGPASAGQADTLYFINGTSCALEVMAPTAADSERARKVLVLHAEGGVRGERPASVIEEVVVPAGSRVAVVERRLW